MSSFVEIEAEKNEDGKGEEVDDEVKIEEKM